MSAAGVRPVNFPSIEGSPWSVTPTQSRFFASRSLGLTFALLMLPITDVFLYVVGKATSAIRSRPFVGLLTAAAVVSLYRLKKHRKRKAPSLRAAFGGPTRFCNTLLGLVPESIQHTISTSEILADTYGDAFAMRILGRDCLILTNGKLIREVLKKRPHSFVRSFNDLSSISGMLTTEGEEWKRPTGDWEPRPSTQPMRQQWYQDFRLSPRDLYAYWKSQSARMAIG